MQHTFSIKLHNLSLFLIKHTWKQALTIIRIARVCISSNFSLFLVLHNKLNANLDKKTSTIIAILNFFNHSRSQFGKMGMEFFFPNLKYFRMNLPSSTIKAAYSQKTLLSHLQIAQQNHCPPTCQSKQKRSWTVIWLNSLETKTSSENKPPLLVFTQWLWD